MKLNGALPRSINPTLSRSLRPSGTGSERVATVRVLKLASPLPPAPSSPAIACLCKVLRLSWEQKALLNARSFAASRAENTRCWKCALTLVDLLKVSCRAGSCSNGTGVKHLPALHASPPTCLGQKEKTYTPRGRGSASSHFIQPESIRSGGRTDAGKEKCGAKRPRATFKTFLARAGCVLRPATTIVFPPTAQVQRMRWLAKRLCIALGKCRCGFH